MSSLDSSAPTADEPRQEPHPPPGGTPATRPDAARPRRVLHLTEAAGGGVRRHLQRIVPELRRLGLGVDILVGIGRAEAGLEEDLAAFRACGCRTATFRSGGTLQTWRRGRPALRRALREWQPDVVHLHATRAGLIGRLGRRRDDGAPPVVYSPHAFAFQERRGIMPWLALALERALAPATPAVVCVSAPECDLARRRLGLDPGRLHVIENGLETDFRQRLLSRQAARAAWGLPPEAFLIGFCGRLVPQKDPALALAALGTTPPGQARLAICGDGALASALRRQAQRQGLESSLLWLGTVPDLPQRLAAFDLLLLPSRYEGFPYILLEALAAGVPILASDIPPHLPRPWLRGPVRLVADRRPEAWQAALHQAWADRADLKRLAEAVAPRVVEEFSARGQAEALAELYGRIAGART